MTNVDRTNDMCDKERFAGNDKWIREATNPPRKLRMCSYGRIHFIQSYRVVLGSMIGYGVPRTCNLRV